MGRGESGTGSRKRRCLLGRGTVRLLQRVRAAAVDRPVGMADFAHPATDSGLYQHHAGHKLMRPVADTVHLSYTYSS
jgi:hypothetical protein